MGLSSWSMHWKLNLLKSHCNSEKLSICTFCRQAEQQGGGLGAQPNSVQIFYQSLCQVLWEVDLRKESYSLGRKTLQHPQLLEQKLRQGGKVKRASSATMTVWQLSCSHWMDLNFVPSMYGGHRVAYVKYLGFSLSVQFCIHMLLFLSLLYLHGN